MNTAKQSERRSWNTAGAEVQSLIFGDFLKEGQFLPVALKTAAEGSSFDFTPKILQLRGNCGSQVTAKWMHLRQFGGLSGVSIIDRHTAPLVVSY
jgi:hypothetical protein